MRQANARDDQALYFNRLPSVAFAEVPVESADYSLFLDLLQAARGVAAPSLDL
jgi:hypothetical protein